MSRAFGSSCGRFLLAAKASGIILACLFLPGCYAAVAGIVLGVIASGDSSKSGENDPPLVVGIDVPARVNGDLVRVSYSVVDDDVGPVDVMIEWQVTGEPGPGETPWFFAGSPVLSDDRTEVIFDWSARADILREVRKKVAPVRLRIHARAGAREGPPAMSATFWAGNEPPVISCESQGPCPELRASSGFVPIEFKLSDSSEDRVSVRARYRVVEGSGEACGPGGVQEGDFHDMTLLGGEASGEDLPTAPGGLDTSLTWDSRADLPAEARYVCIELMAEDRYDPGMSLPVVLGPIFIDNNDDPVVIVDVASAADRSFEVPVFLSVQDGESHPVTVALQWALQGKTFPELPDATGIDDLLRSDDPAAREARRRLGILTPAAVLGRGPVDGFAGLPPNQIRVSDLARKGLIFRAATQEGTTPLPAPPFDAGSGLLIIDRPIRLLGNGAPEVTATIKGYDPRTSVITLDRDLAPLSAPAFYELDAGERPWGLESSPRSAAHRFLWDAARDLLDAEAPLDSAVEVRAVGMDSQVGAVVSRSVIQLDTGFLANPQELDTELRPSAVAIGSLGLDDRNLVVIANADSDSASIFVESERDALPTSPELMLRTGSRPGSVAVGDLNGDGRNDIVVVNSGDETAGVYLQKDRPAGPTRIPPFDPAPHWTLTTGENPGSIALGDLNDDGRLDVVIANESSDTATLYFQNASGTLGNPFAIGTVFSLPSRTLETGPRPVSVAAGDLDGDGKDDLALCGWEFSGTDWVLVYFQQELKDGGGSPFEHRLADPRFTVELTPGRRPVRIAIGDLDSDGLEDLVVVNQLDGTLSVFLESNVEGGSNPLVESQVISVGANPAAVAAGDINDDGRNDLVVANLSSNTVTVYLQVTDEGGSRILETPIQTIETRPEPSAVAIGKVDADDKPDVVAVNRGSGFEGGKIYFQSGPGSLPLSPTFFLSTEDLPVWVALGDVSADGRADVVVANEGSDTATVYLQPPSGLPAESPSYVLLAGKMPACVALGDVNADGRGDAVVANKGSDTLSVFLQRPDGRLGIEGADAIHRKHHLVLETGRSPTGVVIGDVSGDGRNDIVAACADSSPGALTVYSGDDAAGFRLLEPVLTGGDGPSAIALADANGDGLLDAVVTNFLSSDAAVLVQDPRGSPPLRGAARLTTDDRPSSVAVADVTGDGREDIVILDSARLKIFRQGASGELPTEPTWKVQTITPPFRVALGDVTGDGRNDMVATNSLFTTTLDVFEQEYAGDSSPDVPPFRAVPTKSLVNSALNTYAVAIGDVNGDGRHDVIVTNRGAATVSVFLAR